MDELTAAWSQYTPVGDLYLETTELGISKVLFGVPGDAKDIGKDPRTYDAIEAYFEDASNSLTELPLDLRGTTSFRTKVMKQLIQIPTGETQTYGEIAELVGSPKGPRAVGQAVGANHICVVVPCHRVLATNGLGGFSGGLEKKEWLLKHEGVLSQ